MPICLNELLGRPLLKIYQDNETFCFSIDSVLLASFATVNTKTNSICDLCTGNGPVALYLSLRSKAKITGVEIQKESVDLAKLSVDANGLQEQIRIINANLININETIGKHTFNLVTCNPPFFKKGAALLNPSDAKTIARHEISATLEDVIKEASLLLNSKGYFALVHRPDRLSEILTLLKKYHLEPKRLQFVYPNNHSECNHILIEAMKDGMMGGLKVLKPLYVYGPDGKWTDDILKIYNYME